MTIEGKQKELADILSGREISGVTLQQIALAIEQERGDLLFEIIDEFFRHAAESRKKTAVEVTTAVPLSEATRKRLETFLSEMVAVESISAIGKVQAGAVESPGEGVFLKASVDPSLLGGLVVRIGSRIIDVSIRGELNRLREAISRDILAGEGRSN